MERAWKPFHIVHFSLIHNEQNTEFIPVYLNEELMKIAQFELELGNASARISTVQAMFSLAAIRQKLINPVVIDF